MVSATNVGDSSSIVYLVGASCFLGGIAVAYGAGKVVKGCRELMDTCRKAREVWKTVSKLTPEERETFGVKQVLRAQLEQEIEKREKALKEAEKKKQQGPELKAIAAMQRKLKASETEAGKKAGKLDSEKYIKECTDAINAQRRVGGAVRTDWQQNKTRMKAEIEAKMTADGLADKEKEEVRKALEHFFT